MWHRTVYHLHCPSPPFFRHVSQDVSSLKKYDTNTILFFTSTKVHNTYLGGNLLGYSIIPLFGKEYSFCSVWSVYFLDRFTSGGSGQEVEYWSVSKDCHSSIRHSLLFLLGGPGPVRWGVGPFSFSFVGSFRFVCCSLLLLWLFVVGCSYWYLSFVVGDRLLNSFVVIGCCSRLLLSREDRFSKSFRFISLVV